MEAGEGTYRDLVRSFDHEGLATHDGYHALRRALSDFSNELAGGGATLRGFLEAVHDMTLTAPYADRCPTCRDKSEMTWPYAVDRDDVGWLKCTYRCPTCRSDWTCGYAVDAHMN